MRYLGVDMVANGTMEAILSHCVGERMKVLGALKNVWKERLLFRRAKIGMSEGI